MTLRGPADMFGVSYTGVSMAENTTADDFGPTASWDMVHLRGAVLRRVRSFFDSRGFLEVETPILSADVVVDRHLDPFYTTLAADPRQPSEGRRLWLQTSPEFHMKRLMAAGGEAIYQITRVFRNGEVGQRHNPEFTMLEWYRRGDDLAAGMQFLSDLADACLHRGAAEQISYSEAFAEHVGVNPLEASSAQLRDVATEQGIAFPDSIGLDDHDVWLDVLWTDRVEPNLGVQRPTIVYAYPASQASLARLSANDPRTAERFELYVRGIELANGYHELLDAAVLEGRSAAANQQRVADGKAQLPEQSRLVVAMRQGLPPCAGVAMGFDRLVMAVAGAASISDVIAFPIDRA